MPIRHLPFFLVVAEERNLRRAAERLCITSSALSRRMHDLEQQIGGVELFVRHHTGITLTPAGEAYREDVQKALDQLGAARARATRVARGEAGILRLGFNVIAFRQRFLGDVIQRFSALSPDVHLELKPDISRQQLDALRDDELDVGLLAGPINDDTLEVVQLGCWPMLLTFADSHRFAKMTSLSLADLRDEKIILFSRAAAPRLHDRIMDEFRKANVVPQVILETVSSATICDLIAIGAGVGFVTASFQQGLPTGSFQRGLPAGLHQRALPDFNIELPFHMAWKRSRTDALITRFVDMVLESCQTP
jgi:DNA-binding transcriptional LysR family regulator